MREVQYFRGIVGGENESDCTYCHGSSCDSNGAFTIPFLDSF